MKVQPYLFFDGCVEVRPVADDPKTLRALGLPAGR
jgi:hypothetical protein